MFWKFLGIWPSNDLGCFYKYYSILFVITFKISYDLLMTINFYFVPRHLDSITEDMLFYFLEIAITSKVFTFYFMHDKIVDIFKTLQSDTFQPVIENAVKVIEETKKFYITYRKAYAIMSYLGIVVLLLPPVLVHQFMSVNLVLPVCSYSFVTEEMKSKIIYLLYFYQSIGMVFHGMYNVNIDTFFLGVLFLTIAQLENLDEKLRNITITLLQESVSGRSGSINDDDNLLLRLNNAVEHYEKVSK